MPIQTPYFTNYDAIIAINHQWQIWQLDNLWKNRFSVNSTHGQDVVQTGQFVESAFGKNTLQLPIFGHVSSEFSENWRVCESFSPSVNQSANWFVCKSSTVGSKISQPLLLISIVKSFLSHLVHKEALLSQSMAEAAWPRSRGQCIVWCACLLSSLRL